MDTRTRTEERKPTVVIGVIGFDCHSVGNKILDAFFSERGFRVINLGVMTSQDEFISAAIESGADAILVSSLYGHGEIDCMGMRGRCVERGIADIILWVGGNLVVGKTPLAEVADKFRRMGFDRVFPSDTDLEAAARILREDIASRRSARRGTRRDERA